MVELTLFRQTIAERTPVAEKDFGVVKKHFARRGRDKCVLTEPTTLSTDATVSLEMSPSLPH